MGKAMKIKAHEDEFGNDLLTIKRGNDMVTLGEKQITKVVVAALDAYGWSWLKEELERYLIYVDM